MMSAVSLVISEQFDLMGIDCDQRVLWDQDQVILRLSLVSALAETSGLVLSTGKISLQYR